MYFSGVIRIILIIKSELMINSNYLVMNRLFPDFYILIYNCLIRYYVVKVIYRVEENMQFHGFMIYEMPST